MGYASLILIALLAAKSASAAPVIISSTVAQSGFNGTSTASNPLTSTHWDFTGQQYNLLTDITSISVTLTVTDGDTDLGDFDEGRWTLALDGWDTGLVLDGFSGAAQIVTLTLTANPALSATILAALQSDAQLAGSIIDHTAGDNEFVLPSRITTTLDITGNISDSTGGGGPSNVPLPAAALMAPVAAAFATWRARRMHRQVR